MNLIKERNDHKVLKHNPRKLKEDNVCQNMWLIILEIPNQSYIENGSMKDIKIFVVGRSGVGKTSMLQSYIQNIFLENVPQLIDNHYFVFWYKQKTYRVILMDSITGKKM